MIRRIAYVCILFSLLVACGNKHSTPTDDDKSEAVNKYHTIFVVSHGWHTGLVVKRKDIGEQLIALEKRFTDRMWLEIGWGDKGFYRTDEITTWVTIKALFWPTEAVMHVVGFNYTPELEFPSSEVSRVLIKDKHYEKMLHYIVESFAVDENNKIGKLGTGLYGDSQFYQAKGNFNLFNTCNVWTGNALHMAGVEFDSWFKLTASSIMDGLP